MELIHYTNLSNLPNILQSGKILDNLARGKMHVVAGEGDPARKFCYPNYSYNTRPYKCDETCSVFMRIRKPDQPFVKPFGKKEDEKKSKKKSKKKGKMPAFLKKIKEKSSKTKK